MLIDSKFQRLLNNRLITYSSQKGDFSLKKRNNIIKKLNIVNTVFFFILCTMLSVSLNQVYSLTQVQSFVGENNPYANFFLEEYTMYCYNGENAVGAPDGSYAILYPDYSNGYITLDMGRYEEIINGEGDDFKIIGGSGNYTVWVGNDLSSPFTIISYGSNNKSFDLSTINMDEVRYVKIEYRSGDCVEIDAVIALNYNIPTEEGNAPEINQLTDIIVYNNITKIELCWETIETNPWNYSIYVNDSLVFSKEWVENTITYIFKISGIGETTIKLELLDAYNNRAFDTVKITVMPIPAKSEPTEETAYSYSFISSLILIITIAKIKKRSK